MKTTIDLPDEMLHRAKIVAAQRKTTLKELVMQGLEHVTQSIAQDQEQRRQETMKRLICGLQASNETPMIPLKRSEIFDR